MYKVKTSEKSTISGRSQVPFTKCVIFINYFTLLLEEESINILILQMEKLYLMILNNLLEVTQQVDAGSRILSPFYIIF